MFFNVGGRHMMYLIALRVAFLYTQMVVESGVIPVLVPILTHPDNKVLVSHPS